MMSNKLERIEAREKYRFSTLCFLVVALLTMLPHMAFADCAMPQHPGAKKGTVAATWAAKHVTDGDISGCLLKFNMTAGGEWLGYTRYDFICNLDSAEQITLMPDFACCDTGDHGDFACGVKSRSIFNTLPRVNITMAPALPDARAIPEMVKALMGGRLRDAVAAIKLKEYLDNPALAEEVKKQIAPLETALDKNTVADSYMRAQVAALLAAAFTASPKQADWQIEYFKGDIGYSLTDAQKSVLATLKEDSTTAERFIPVLVQKLRQTDEEGRRVILEAIAAYGVEAKSYRDVLRDAFTSELPADRNKPRKMPVVTPKDAVEAARHAAMLEEMKKQDTEKAARVIALMPWLVKIACEGEAGSVTIGKNYPTTLDCTKKP